MAIKIQGTTVIDDGRQLNVIGVNTISNVEISSGIVTAVSGVVTYYGDGSNLDGIEGGVSISTNTTNQAQYIPYATSFGLTTGLGATTLLVYNPSTTSLGIGTTSPDAAIHVVDDILVSAGAAATLDVRIKAYSDEGGSISFEDAVYGSSIFTLQQGDSDILFDVSTSPTNQVFQVGVDSSIIISSGVSTADFKIKAYDDELGAISFEDATDATQYFSITQDLSTILFGVNDASLNTKFVVGPTGNVGINTDLPGTNNLDVYGNVNVTGVITATNYYGDGSTLDNAVAALSPGSGIQRLVITGLGTVGVLTNVSTKTDLVFDSTNTSLGIGTTSPDAALHVVDDILVSAGAAATLDTRIKAYTNENGSISFEDSVDGSSIFTLQQGDSDILFDVSISPANQVFQVGVDSSIIISSGVSTADFKIKAYDEELGSISFEDATDATQYFSITQDLSTILFGVNDASLNTKFVVDASGNVGIQTDTVGASRALDVYGNVNVTGVITATNYYGDGSTLDNAVAALSPGSGIQRLVITGLGTVGVLTNAATKTDLVFDSTNTSLGIGTTSPDAALHVVDDILVSAGAAATLDTRIKAYTNEGGSISFEDPVDGSSIFTLQQGDSDILFDVSTSPTNQVFIVDANGNVGIQTDTVGASRALDVIGNVVISGSITKGSGTFTIPHPIDSSKLLVHSFIEGPKADLIYRGKSQLSNGISTIAMDSYVGLITGTWESLCRNPQVFVQNNESFSLVKASITEDGILTITSNDNINHEIDWMVIAERDDKVIKDAHWTDNDGNPILEPTK